MSGFSSEWLALREPYDRSARATDLEQELARWAAGRSELRVVDLGSGTGSNLRHLAPKLPCPQHWTLVEHDAALIDAGQKLPRPPGARADYIEADLLRDLDTVFARPIDLVTASALIDLVSADWLAILLSKLQQRPTALLIVLSYDGRMTFERTSGPMPAATRAAGEEALALFNIHQRTDKGFGPALGPHAAAGLVAGLRQLGRPKVSQSDWVFGPADGPILHPFLSGVADAAMALAVDEAQRRRLIGWQGEVQAMAEAGQLACNVGHQDVLFLP